MYDYLVVGAGFAGSTMARLIAEELDKKVLIIDKRRHIGGNAYDEYNEHGILVHRYGPHIFHTNSDKVFRFLSRFTEWRPYEHRVLASVDGQLLPLPINLDTVNRLYGTQFNSFELQAYFDSVRQADIEVKNSRDVIIKKVGEDLYNKFFRNYTRKQWGLWPEELDASVCERIPVRTNRDDRYFTDKYQVMPKQGYTRMFERILDHRNIHIMLAADFEEVRSTMRYGRVVYTGPIDEYFGHCYGRLPYRSLKFEFITGNSSEFPPGIGTINYPNEFEYTRITDMRRLTGQEHALSGLVLEFPTSAGEPYYPVPNEANAELYNKYNRLADEAGQQVIFCGRMGKYSYFNMDQVVAHSFHTMEKLLHNRT